MSKKDKCMLWLLLSLAGAGASLWWRSFAGWPEFSLRLAAAACACLLLLWLPGAAGRFFRRQRYLHSPLSRVDAMSGREFEEFLAQYFQSLGYRVQPTPASHDYGVDLLCWDRQECLAIQAKRYSGTVGVRAVQELLAGMAYYEAEKGLVVTNAYFSRQAYALAEKGGIELWDREALCRFCRLRR